MLARMIYSDVLVNLLAPPKNFTPTSRPPKQGIVAVVHKKIYVTTHTPLVESIYVVKGFITHVGGPVI